MTQEKNQYNHNRRKTGFWTEEYPYWDEIKKEPSIGVQEGNYESGHKEGIWECFRENGSRLKRVYYKQGFMIGLYEMFYPTENIIRFFGQYDENGRKAGVWTWLYKNGKKQKVDNYTNGRKIGLQQHFKTSGKLACEEIIIL